MPYAVYILYSYKDGNLYTGCTSDIDKRLKRHKNGHVQATAHRRPLTLIHTESFESKADAFERERFLKSLWGARKKQEIKDQFLNNNG